MNVTAIQVLRPSSGKRRGWICRRSDGKFQFVTEALQPETDGAPPRWTSDSPPSEIFDRQEEALEALTTRIPGLALLQDIEPQDFDISAGPYPEPE